jgi:hypothetical protein
MKVGPTGSRRMTGRDPDAPQVPRRECVDTRSILEGGIIGQLPGRLRKLPLRHACEHLHSRPSRG